MPEQLGEPLAGKDGLKGYWLDRVHHTTGVIPVYGNALQIVERTSNFQVAHGAGALYAPLEDLFDLPKQPNSLWWQLLRCARQTQDGLIANS